MYDVALSVLSCLRADTDVHVAWIIDGAPGAEGEAVAITPGGGRMGSLLEGALDHALVEAIPGLGERGGLVELTVGPVEALVGGLTEGAHLTAAVVPGHGLPVAVWETLAERAPVAFALGVDDGRFTDVERLASGDPRVELTTGRLTCSFVPVPKVVIAGGGPIADALADGFRLIGWSPAVIPEVGAASGAMATLADLDAVVVMGHDVETSGRALQAAVESDAGYIASIGSPRMQTLREEWLAYRGVDWSDRIHGPAGLSIGASTPGEIAIAIVAEAVADRRLGDRGLGSSP